MSHFDDLISYSVDNSDSLDVHFQPKWGARVILEQFLGSQWGINLVLH